MYNSFPNQVSSAAKWIVIAFFVVLLMAILLGANLKDATWLNSNIAESEAYRIRLDAEHQRALNELDEKMKAAENEASIRGIQREQALLDAQYQHDIQALNQDLAHQDMAFRTWMMIFVIVGSALAITLCLGSLIWIGSYAWVYIQSNAKKERDMTPPTLPIGMHIPNIPEREAYDPWMDPEYRKRQIEEARQKEQREREDMLNLTARMNSISDAQKITTKEYNDLPLGN